MTMHHAPERTRLRRAFRAIRDAGGMTHTGACCPNCSLNAFHERGADTDTTIAIQYAEDVAEAFKRGRMVAPLHIYHAGNSRLVCQALEAEGLRVEWTGNDEDAMAVLPDWRH